MKRENLLVDKLTEYIGQLLEWGERENWSNKDFENLSQRIFDKTEKRLSVTTLKRIWGRAKSTTNPSASSLNILAEFAGFEDWRSFQKTQQSVQVPKSNVFFSRKIRLTMGIAILIFILAGSLAFLSKNDTDDAPKDIISTAIEEISFDFKKVAIGYPNTVIFEYDLGTMEYDKAEIQQSWDESKRIELNDSKGVVTSTYYSSGYFGAKLVIDDVVVTEKDLYIPTEGWRAFLEGDLPRIIYIPEEKISSDTSIRVDEDILNEMNRYFPCDLYVTYLEENPKIDSRNFELITRFRVLEPTDKSICHNSGLVIIGTKDVLLFNFSIAGCVGDLNLILNGDFIDGRNRDLSSFAIDSKDWTQLKVQSENNQLTVYMDDQPIFEHLLKEDIGKIGGAQFSFEGLGEIGELRIKDKENQLDLIPQDSSL